MGFTKATFDYLDAGGLTKWITTPKTSAFTAVSGEGYLVDTTSAAITVTLPAAPSAGDEIIIVDYASNAGTNNITLDPGTLNLRGATDDLVLSTNNQTVRLLYSGATKGWLVTTEAGAAAAAGTPDLTVDYLVVAGGSSGGNNGGGGGGAGGLRTSFGTTSGGGVAAETTPTLFTGTNYTVTVGGAGSVSTFNTITSTAGGGGGSLTSPGSTGGSGGGGGSSYSNGSSASGGAAVTSPVVQGYAGGNSLGGINSPGNLSAGGGGGASEAGSNGITVGVGGDGGDGLEVNIIGGAGNRYAGGGAGGGGTNGGTANPGAGGGGTAGDGSTNAGNGIANTGGGGGGGGNPSLNPGTGGSGIVILRYPHVYDITVGSGLITGTLNTTVGSNEKYTTFTGGTGTITFGAV